MTVTMELNTVYGADARKGLAKLTDDSIDCVMTSPPYWGLRDYGLKPTTWEGKRGCRHAWQPHTPPHQGHAQVGDASAGPNRHGPARDQGRGAPPATLFCGKCGAWRGVLGLEPTVDLYLRHLVAIFDEVRRVLKPSGTCWINLGDTYGGSSTAVTYAARVKGRTSFLSDDLRYLPKTGHVRGRWDKCMHAIPERFTLAMLDRRWTLRNKIVWHKPNHMPSSARDRFTNSWEYLLFFVKSPRYHFDLDSVREPRRDPRKACAPPSSASVNARAAGSAPLARHSPDVHCRRGSPHQAKGKNPGDTWSISTQPFPGALPGAGAHFAVFPEKLCERPIKAGCPEGGIVLDPFAGSGTTLVVAKRMGRRFIGFEASPSYVAMAKRQLGLTAQNEAAPLKGPARLPRPRPIPRHDDHARPAN